MSDTPTPPISPDVDLRNLPYTPLFRSRLFGSEFHAHANDGAWRAGVTLWLKSWDQTPGGSLPDDEVALCRLAELGRDLKMWGKVREWAMHGWYKCSDGRLYHSVVAEGVNDAWQSKIAQRDRTATARAARLSQRLSQNANGAHDKPVTKSATDTVEPLSHHPTEHNITEHKKESPPRPPGGGRDPDGFADWYEGWPHKVGKQAAVRAFAKAIKLASLAELLDAEQRYVRDKPPDRAWCNPATWLNEHRWLDKPAIGAVNGHDVSERRKPQGPPPPVEEGWEARLDAQFGPTRRG
jgi:hypothetical protein